MKRNAEAVSSEAEQNPSLHVVETPRQGGGARTLPFPSASHAPRPRPEIAVLGWDERSYRLALRESKV